jgi:hypothetical protein
MEGTGSTSVAVVSGAVSGTAVGTAEEGGSSTATGLQEEQKSITKNTKCTNGTDIFVIKRA